MNSSCKSFWIKVLNDVNVKKKMNECLIKHFSTLTYHPWLHLWKSKHIINFETAFLFQQFFWKHCITIPWVYFYFFKEAQTLELQYVVSSSSCSGPADGERAQLRRLSLTDPSVIADQYSADERCFDSHSCQQPEQQPNRRLSLSHERNKMQPDESQYLQR